MSDAEEVRRELELAIAEFGDQTALALAIGCSKQAISRMQSGAGPWRKIYEPLGFEGVQMFRRVKQRIRP